MYQCAGDSGDGGEASKYEAANELEEADVIINVHKKNLMAVFWSFRFIIFLHHLFSFGSGDYSRCRKCQLACQSARHRNNTDTGCGGSGSGGIFRHVITLFNAPP